MPPATLPLACPCLPLTLPAADTLPDGRALRVTCPVAFTTLPPPACRPHPACLPAWFLLGRLITALPPPPARLLFCLPLIWLLMVGGRCGYSLGLLRRPLCFVVGGLLPACSALPCLGSYLLALPPACLPACVVTALAGALLRVMFYIHAAPACCRLPLPPRACLTLYLLRWDLCCHARACLPGLTCLPALAPCPTCCPNTAPCACRRHHPPALPLPYYHPLPPLLTWLTDLPCLHLPLCQPAQVVDRTPPCLPDYRLRLLRFGYDVILPAITSLPVRFLLPHLL